MNHEKEIINSYSRIKNFINKTPLIESDYINKLLNSRIFIKCENLQKTGSFKIRGAVNFVSKLNHKKTLVAPSSGNHAQAIAKTASIFELSSILVMPKDSPKVKIDGVIKNGGKIHFYDRYKEGRLNIAKKIAKKINGILVPPYDHYDIIHGQGTIGLEAISQLKEKNIIPDLVLCCCGGGGLISGISLSLKSKWPNLNIHPIEPKNWNDTQLSLESGKRIKVEKKIKSLCDALLAETPGKITFPINKKLLSHGLTVSDSEVLKTIYLAYKYLKIIIEPGGAVALASALKNKKFIEKKNVLVIVSGGNIDNEIFKKSLNNNLS